MQEAAAPDQLIASMVANGCASATVWISSNGALIGYLPGAPAFVNQAFPSSVPAGTPFIVNCD